MKTIFILLLSAAIGLTSWQIVRNKKELAVTNKGLRNLEEIVELRREELKALVLAVQLQKDNTEKLATLTQINSKEAELKATYDKLVSRKTEIVVAIRKTMVGKTVPELTLVGGKKLTAISVQNADETGLTVSHATGSQKITPSELSADWRKKLYYND